MSNPFDRNKTKEARLGELITEPGEQNQRDAVHIAVVPVTARNNLSPGQHVGVTPDGKTAGTPGGLFSDAVGIVDPFLDARVMSGDAFWLFLYQGQVTTLRHEWTHPAFPNATMQVSDESARKGASEKWLRDWCATHDCPRYETVLAYVLEGRRASWDRSYLHFDGIDAHDEIPDEFWNHMEVVTGMKFEKDDRATGFSCSC